MREKNEEKKHIDHRRREINSLNETDVQKKKNNQMNETIALNKRKWEQTINLNQKINIYVNNKSIEQNESKENKGCKKKKKKTMVWMKVCKGKKPSSF